MVMKTTPNFYMLMFLVFQTKVVMLAALGRYIPIQHSGPAVQNNIHANVIEGVLNRRLLHNGRACWHFAPAYLLYNY